MPDKIEGWDGPPFRADALNDTSPLPTAMLHPSPALQKRLDAVVAASAEYDACPKATIVEAVRVFAQDAISNSDIV